MDSPAAGLDEVAGTVRFALKRIQYRPELIEGCLAKTGLIIHPPQLATTSHLQSR